MNSLLNDFPLLGSSCSAALGAAAAAEETWLLTSIETLADPPADELGDLWRRVQVGPSTLRTDVLCAALNLASQVITLDVRLTANPSIQLLIEDGVTVVCKLG